MPVLFFFVCGFVLFCFFSNLLFIYVFLFYCYAQYRTAFSHIQSNEENNKTDFIQILNESQDIDL